MDTFHISCCQVKGAAGQGAVSASQCSARAPHVGVELDTTYRKFDFDFSCSRDSVIRVFKACKRYLGPDFNGAAG